MLNDLSLLPYFITEDLYLLPEDRQVAAKPDTATASVKETAESSGKRSSSPEPKQKPAPSAPEKAAPAAEQQKEKSSVNPQLVFGKNLKKMLVLVEDPAHPVMERADGLLLKDILKAVGYTFDDVAIVNICHCKQDVDWEAVNQLPYTHLFSFGVSNSKLPATVALAPYELESSGDKRFLLTDKLSVLRNDRDRKITLWNLLKKIFV